MATAGIDITFRYVLKFERVHARAKMAEDRVQKRALSTLRTIWRRSIRYRKGKSSAAGEIPFTHVRSGQFGLRSILWFYDSNTGEAIVGPIGGSERTGAPKALEQSGRAKIKLPPRARRKLGRKFITAHIRARPSGGPAVETFSKTYPELWKGAVK